MALLSTTVNIAIMGVIDAEVRELATEQVQVLSNIVAPSSVRVDDITMEVVSLPYTCFKQRIAYSRTNGCVSTDYIALSHGVTRINWEYCNNNSEFSVLANDAGDITVKFYHNGTFFSVGDLAATLNYTLLDAIHTFDAANKNVSIEGAIEVQYSMLIVPPNCKLVAKSDDLIFFSTALSDSSPEGSINIQGPRLTWECCSSN